jgi:glycosyltransferase involved in cell wall biosynthesis
MKVLYISHNKEGTAWASTANNHMLALHSAGVDVVSRTVKINDSNGQVPDLVKSFECKNTDNVDAIIQHVLPHYYETTSVCKNIGMYLNDMDTLNFANWGRKLSLMDEIWCPNNKTKDAITKYTSKVEVVPHPCDTSVYDKEYKKMDFRPHNGNFIFYFIGELNSRKNIKDLIRAFHTEFSPSEPVSLLLKVNKLGISTDQMMNILVGEINQVKDSLKLYPRIDDYSKEIIIAGHVTEDEIYQIHNTCDCYVNTSHGEAWSIPTFDAQGFGNQVIAPHFQYDYLKDFSCYSYESDDVFGYKDTFHQLGNSSEKWLVPSITGIRRCMRECYMNPNVLKSVSNYTNDIIQKHSIENIGKLMLEKLCET